MDVDIKVIEIGGTFLILAVFIALFAIAGSTAVLKPWLNLVYVVLFLAFAVTISLFGLRLAPYLNQ